ncbi:MAG: peptidoglycan editing factor PgeF [Anaerolineae bacterium]|nr:peptidoglycan editing factor PgeF [Anaerolineae bacterium]
MQRIEVDGLVYYQFEMWADAPIKHGVFTRLGGVSPAPWGTLNLGGTVGDTPEAVAENHRRMYEILGVNRQRICTVWQVHSADTVIAYEPAPNRKWLDRADGLVTDQKDTPLAMRFADCVPILYYDPVNAVVGMAHAGWRGTISGAQVSVVNTMQDAFGCRPSNIQVGIGPSIGPAWFQVGEEVVRAFEESYESLDGLLERADDGTAYLDLWEANRRKLPEAGIEHIEVVALCTASNTHEFFSHRAEKGRTGRFGAVISL